MHSSPRRIRHVKLNQIAGHMGLVHKLARELWESIQRSLPIEDLVSYGTLGLLEARTRYQKDRNVAFSTFAYYRIRGAILDGIRKMSGLPPSVYCKARAMQKMAAHIESTLTAATDIDNPATMWQTLSQILQGLEMVYLCSIPGVLPDVEAESADQAAHRRQMCHRLKAALSELNDEERQLIQRVYFEDQSLAEAARSMGRSRSWACRMHRRAIQHLHRGMASPQHPETSKDMRPCPSAGQQNFTGFDNGHDRHETRRQISQIK